MLDTFTCKPKTEAHTHSKHTERTKNYKQQRQQQEKKYTPSAEHPKRISEVNKHFTRTHSPISSLLLFISLLSIKFYSLAIVFFYCCLLDVDVVVVAAVFVDVANATTLLLL